MNFLSKKKFTSKKYPEVEVTIRTVTIGRRMEFMRSQRAAGDDFEWRKIARALWNSLIEDFEGVTIDDLKPTVDELFLNGPEDLVDEISTELMRLVSGPVTDADEKELDLVRKQVEEVEARLAKRKNSGPQSSSPSPEPGTSTAASASGTPTMLEESGSEEIVEEIPR